MNGASIEHIPVLAKILAEQINLPPDGVMVDATVGQGGHSLLFGQSLGPQGVIIGLDLDEKVVEAAKFRLKALSCKVVLIRANFSQIKECVLGEGIEKVDFILADLGLCSAQLVDAEMGLSFQTNMPLDMRIDKRLQNTAADIINKIDEKSLADLIWRFGEDKASRRIARAIVRERLRRPIGTTMQLAAVVSKAVGRPEPRTARGVHPATRTFQALRIAVNNELENLKGLLRSAPTVLKSGGRIGVISFHSLEDRLVKNDFRQNEKESIYRIVSKKPIVPSAEEIARNRRARSAKLRIAERR